MQDLVMGTPLLGPNASKTGAGVGATGSSRLDRVLELVTEHEAHYREQVCIRGARAGHDALCNSGRVLGLVVARSANSKVKTTRTL